MKSLSGSVDVSSGVPQESVLDPTLFNVILVLKIILVLIVILVFKIIVVMTLITHAYGALQTNILLLSLDVRKKSAFNRVERKTGDYGGLK